MATYVAMQNEVLAYGFDDNVYRARVKNWLNEAQARIAKTAELIDLLTTSTISAVANTSSYNLPADLVQVDGVVDATYNDWVRWEPQYKTLLAEIGANPTVTGRPVRYAVTATQIVFYPVPDTAITYTLTYYKRPTDLS